MNKQIIAVAVIVDIFVVAGVLIWWQPWSTPVASLPVPARAVSDKSTLEQQFAEAQRSQNFEALCALVCWDGVDEFTRQSVEQSLRDDLQRSLSRVSYLPGEPSLLPTYEVNGVSYVPNLEVTGQLVVEFEPDETGRGATTYLVGLQAGVPMIATAAPAQP